MSISVFGIRHHGPGCARSLRQALTEYQPDIVLVEGPPDAQQVLPLCMHQEMRPPVAILIYAPEHPKRAVFYPFTTFSPEWQALRYSFEQGIETRFMDLPQAMQMALRLEHEEQAEQTEQQEPQALDHPGAEAEPGQETRNATLAPAPQTEEREDPLGMLAEAAGYSDHESWWEQQIEQRVDSRDIFAAILEAMSALREGRETREEDALREAYMRQCIRTAQREGFQRIAVVCGAWHAPVLVDPGAPGEDQKRLKGLKKLKIEATWIPWTNSRLSYRSGYGAGITSPGWYEHLWKTPDQAVVRWVTRAARLLRKEDLDASSASVIEAVRLSETLAALRELPMPGLTELHEAIQTVLCHGNTEPMQLIREKLEIGERLGHVPEETPAIPLQRDLEQQQRQLRMAPSPESTRLELDLRKESALARSQLLHRLALLKIPWGKTLHTGNQKQGTFWEYWQVQWQVDFVVTLIEASAWGNTVFEAASAVVAHQAEDLQELPQLTSLLDQAMLAALPQAIAHLLTVIQQRAAVSADIRHLMDAMPPLARIARYGNVRGAQAELVQPILTRLFERVLVGLPSACSSLDDDAARGMLTSINHVQEALSLLNQEEERQDWQKLLRRLMEQEDLHGLLRGRSCRLLLEQHVIDGAELQRQTRLALTPALPAAQAARWIEGVLMGSGLIVLHQEELWSALDSWLSDLSGETFEALLPILRRAFSEFEPPERRAMGEKVKYLRTMPGQNGAVPGMTTSPTGVGFDQQRAEGVLPVLAQLMGVRFNDHN
ncbi:DUF5682 family protein [Ktedonobacter racemifer]|uniref:Uncharacterized protein n=1 Tax=Ktedonobacter racemifer DSM 44963 TaxID=485913 RepID=D6TIQ8_KTERA|nr:DUF5682 family protein [Ktedonobacter racemifer]EFH89315.1 conserved hypothetical protein [Ktedonobacter racemifer DSM 44963]